MELAVEYVLKAEERTMFAPLAVVVFGANPAVAVVASCATTPMRLGVKTRAKLVAAIVEASAAAAAAALVDTWAGAPEACPIVAARQLEGQIERTRKKDQTQAWKAGALVRRPLEMMALVLQLPLQRLEQPAQKQYHLQTD